VTATGGDHRLASADGPPDAIKITGDLPGQIGGG
jgi:hypothetical protein